LGLKKPDEALKHFQQASDVFEKIGDHWNTAISLDNMGVAYYDLGKRATALRNLRKALKLFNRVGAEPQIEKVSKEIHTIEKEKEDEKRRRDS